MRERSCCMQNICPVGKLCCMLVFDAEGCSFVPGRNQVQLHSTPKRGPLGPKFLECLYNRIARLYMLATHLCLTWVPISVARGFGLIENIICLAHNEHTNKYFTLLSISGSIRPKRVQVKGRLIKPVAREQTVNTEGNSQDS